MRKFNKPVEVDVAGRPSTGFRSTTGAPERRSSTAVAWVDCEHRADCGGHTLFVAEVVDCAFQQGDTPVLRMEDTRMSYGDDECLGRRTFGAIATT